MPRRPHTLFLPASRRQFLQSCGLSAGVALTTGLWTPLASAQDRLAMKVADLPGDHKLTPAIRIATDAARACDAVSDYKATFVKSELVGSSMLKARIAVKIRQEPFSVYMKFVAPNAGRELIYVEGMNGGNLKVHETGFAALVGTLTLDPKGSLAMGESRYPVTMMGIETMVDTIIDQWVSETSRTSPQVQYFPNATLGSTACKAIESTHAAPGPTVKFQRTRLYIGQQSGLPVRVQQYAFDRAGGEPMLVEDYAYLDVQTNVGLTNLDFDVSNPAYNF